MPFITFPQLILLSHVSHDLCGQTALLMATWRKDGGKKRDEPKEDIWE